MSLVDPDYYIRDGIQLEEVILLHGLGYHLGCVVKYCCRAGYKDPDPVADLSKALKMLELAFRHFQQGLVYYLANPANRSIVRIGKRSGFEVINAWQLGNTNRAYVIDCLLNRPIIHMDWSGCLHATREDIENASI